MASGKSTIAQLLAEQLESSVHLRGDTYRKMIVNGRVNMSSGPSEVALQQLSLRYDLGVSAALRYAEGGFTVIYQDVILGEYLRSVSERLRPGDCVFVLCPSCDALAHREASRTKTGYVGFTPEHLDDVLRNETPRIGYWLDSSNLTPSETVAELLAHVQNAKLDGSAT